MTPELADAIETILRPIVKIMLRNGVNLNEIFSITRMIYKSVAHDEGIDTSPVSRAGDLVKQRHEQTLADENLLRIGSIAICDLAGTVGFNINRPTGEAALLQLSASYASIPNQGKALYRSILKKDTMDFIDQQNRILASLDRSNNPDIEGPVNNRIGVGIYYFEGPSDD